MISWRKGKRRSKGERDGSGARASIYAKWTHGVRRASAKLVDVS